MVGTNNSGNRFGPSSYIVGPSYDGANYLSIVAAINQAIADGYSSVNPTTIQIREGTYVENVNISDGIYLIGVGDPSKTIISGNATITAPAGSNYYLENLQFNATTGVALAVSGGNSVLFKAINCQFIAQNPGDSSYTNVAGASVNPYEFEGCTFTADSYAMNSLTGSGCKFTNCQFNNNNLWGATAGGIGPAYFYGCYFNAPGAGGAEINATGDFYNCRFDTGTLSIRGPTATINCYDCVFNQTDVGGTIIFSNVLNYGNIISTSNANSLLVTFQNPKDWKPYATSTVKGTASFNANQFTVTSGAVSLSGNNSSLPAFQALKSANTVNATGDGTNVQVIFDTVQFDQTGSYNNATGLFTAPQTGKYWFYATVAGLNFAAGHTTGYLLLYVNGLAGIEYVEYAVNPFAMRELSTGALNFWAHEMISLTAGDTVQINFLVSGGAKTVTLAGNPSPLITTRFGGHLIC